MKALFVGAGGFIGEAVATAFLLRGWQIVCISRTGKGAAKPGRVNLAADRTRPDQIRDIATDHSVDVVVDFVAYTAADTEPLLKQLEGHVARYVLISSGDVYRQYGLMHRLEDGEMETKPINETAPLRRSRFPYRGVRPRTSSDPLKWMDDYDKVPVEALVQKMKTPWTVLRLPMVFGPGDPQSRFAWATRPMRAGITSATCPESWWRWTTTYGDVSNIASAIALASEAKGAENAIFNVVDFAPVPHSAWFQCLSKTLNWQGELTLTDDPSHPISKATSTLDLTVPFRIDGTLIRNTIGWRPPVSVTRALDRLVSV